MVVLPGIVILSRARYDKLCRDEWKIECMTSMAEERERILKQAYFQLADRHNKLLVDLNSSYPGSK